MTKLARLFGMPRGDPRGELPSERKWIRLSVSQRRRRDNYLPRSAVSRQGALRPRPDLHAVADRHGQDALAPGHSPPVLAGKSIQAKRGANRHGTVEVTGRGIQVIERSTRGRDVELAVDHERRRLELAVAGERPQQVAGSRVVRIYPTAVFSVVENTDELEVTPRGKGRREAGLVQRTHRRAGGG